MDQYDPWQVVHRHLTLFPYSRLLISFAFVVDSRVTGVTLGCSEIITFTCGRKEKKRGFIATF